MKRVLMLCYYYPPIVASGTTRSLAFSKLLSSFGWEPTVLTVKETMDPWVKVSPGAEPFVLTYRTHEWNLGGACDFLHGATSKIAGLIGKDLKTNWYRELFCVPDQQIAWLSSATGSRLARECDVVYASCSPFSSAMSACLIKKRTGKPAVVDFRDAWTLNPHVRHSGIHNRIIAAAEKWVVETADALILNTEGAGRLYREKYPAAAERIFVLPNGYDDLTPVSATPSGETFTIMHIGSFYGSRSPRLLLEAMSELPELPLELVQVGGTFEGAEEFRGRVRMTIHETLPRKAAMEEMKKASLLYLKQGWEEGVTSYIAVAAKTYEYLATGLPILADVPPGDNADIVRDYGARTYLVESESKELLKQALQKAYAERTLPPAAITDRFKDTFDRKKITGRLAEILERVSVHNAR